MTIQNDFLEFLQQPRCKTALMVMTVIIFLAMAIAELVGRPSLILQNLAVTAFGFWAGRATKRGK